MAFNSKEVPILQVGPIIGLDATSDPSTVDGQHATVLTNVMPQRQQGAYVTAQGRIQFAPALVGPMECDPIKFYTSATAYQYLAFCSNGNIYRFANNTAATQVTTGLNANRNAKFIVAQQWAFFSDANSKTIKIDQNFNVTNWGIVAPTTAPTLAAGTSAHTTTGTNTGSCSTAAASALVTQNNPASNCSATITCVSTLHKPDPTDPSTWFYSYFCVDHSDSKLSYPFTCAAPVAAGSQVSFTPTTLSGGNNVNLQLLDPNGNVLQTWTDIVQGTPIHYSNAAAIAGQYTWVVSIDTSTLTGNQGDTPTSGTYTESVTSTISWYSQGGASGVTPGASSIITATASVAPISAATQISITLSALVVPSDANGHSGYVVAISDSTGAVWYKQTNITAGTTINWYDSAGTALPGDYTIAIFANAYPSGGGGTSTYACSANYSVTWDQTVSGGLTAGGAYAYGITFGNAVQESSCPVVAISPFFTLSNSAGSANFNISGTTLTAGTAITLTFFPNQSNQASGVVSYTLVSTDTLATAAMQLAANINLAIAQQGDKNIALPQGGATSDAAGNIFFYNTGTNPLPYAGAVTNAGGGNLAVTPTAKTNCPPASVQTAISLSNIPLSADSQVTLRNLYRIGGGQAQFELVGTINDNTTTTYTDTLADLSITGQTLVPHRDPPQAFTDIVFYQDRVWGLGYSSSSPYSQEEAWYSLYRQPWGFDNTNQVLVVGENPGNDPIVGGAALPNMLLVLKRQSAWGILGSSQADYLPVPLFPIGAAGKQSIKSGYGVVCWLSPDGIVFAFDGNGAPQDISTMTQSKCSVKGILDTLTLADYQAAVGFFNKNCYYLSFPTQGFTLGYYMPSQAWFKLGWATNGVEFDLSANEVIAGDNAGNLSQWFAAETDLGAAITATLTTGYAFDPAGGASQARHLILSSLGNGNVNANVTVTAYYEQTSASNTQTVSLLSSRQAVSLPPTLSGQAFQMSISTTTSTKTTINNCTLFAYPKRALNPKG